MLGKRSKRILSSETAEFAGLVFDSSLLGRPPTVVLCARHCRCVGSATEARDPTAIILRGYYGARFVRAIRTAPRHSSSGAIEGVFRIKLSVLEAAAEAV